MERLSVTIKHGIMDAHSIIAYNKRDEGEMESYDQHFAPPCVREYLYRYGSNDRKYKTLNILDQKSVKTVPWLLIRYAKKYTK